MDTYSAILRRWKTAGELRAALLKQGCDASEVLIRRWWNDDMLPPRAMAPLADAAKEAGYRDVTVERLLKIAATDRGARLAYIHAARSEASLGEAQPAA